jgi:hypothetical protein
MRIFVSFQTPDLEIARRLADAISSRRPNTEIFFAPRAFTAGAFWLPRLAAEVENSDVLLFIAGNRVGPWQELEYYEAVRLSRNPAKPGRPLIVPVVIADNAPGLPFFSQYHQIYSKNPAEDSLDVILHAIDGAAPEGEAPWKRFNPYKGLAAFTSADAAFFFGREALTADILTLMHEQPNKALALIGNSGVGKSSVAQAGVMAALRSQIWPCGAEWPGALEESRSWLTLTVRPEDKPLKALTLAFARLLFDETYRQDAEAEGWAQRFRDGANFSDFLRVVKQGLSERLAAEAPPRFVLYIDQGEELYASTEREGKPNAIAQLDADAFSRVIAEATARNECYVLFSLRSDYYGRLQSDTALFAVTHRIDVPPMPATALQQAIERPASALGVRFHPSEMAHFLAAATAREAGALPLLAYLLGDMWKEMQARGDGVMRFDERPEVFDVSAALRERAERYRVQNKVREGDLKRLFTLRLAQVPRLGDVLKRRARRAECSIGEWRIAEELSGEDWRLVTLTLQDLGTEVLAEVAHEQILRKWPALGEWLKEQRDFLTWKAEVEARRDKWLASQGDLLSGRELIIARDWWQSRGEDITLEDRSYIEASKKVDDERLERERQQAESLTRVAWQREQAEVKAKEDRRRLVSLLLSILLASTLIILFSDTLIPISDDLARKALLYFDADDRHMPSFMALSAGAILGSTIMCFYVPLYLLGKRYAGSPVE